MKKKVVKKKSNVVLKKNSPLLINKKKSLTLKRSDSDASSKKLFIVGIGASAGGLEAMQELFDNMPPDSGMAFVIVQHLDPTHKSLLSELLGRRTAMNVAEAKEGTKVKANCVYVIPPNSDLRIFQGKLQLLKPLASRSMRRPIDSFFHSLAEDQKDKAIGIVLSGAGTEGALGLKDIKAEGGMTIVQESSSAQFDGMPLSAIISKTADNILIPNRMPELLMKYVSKRKNEIVGTLPDLPPSFLGQLKKIFHLVRSRTGYDFSNYKMNTIARRIMKRAALVQIDSMDEYILFLQNSPTEIELLYKEFLIGVTSFFRDKKVFESLEKRVIPHLLKKCAEQQEFRIWVCGCSTGEEAYSLAILLKEALEKSKQYSKVMIFATDIDNGAIEFARSGVYSESIAEDISAERLTRFFVRRGNSYMLKTEIREMVVFAHHNVIKDPPFSKIDLITCRNLLIYLNDDLQKKVIPIFHYSLNKHGVLLLGMAESIGEYTNLFDDFDHVNRIFLKKQDVIGKKQNVVNQLTSIEKIADTSTSISDARVMKKINISSLTNKLLLNHYAPPSVIIDKNNVALFFSGNTGRFLEPPMGEASFNILNMAKTGLSRELETAINKARSNNEEVQVDNVGNKVNGNFETINLIVKPVLTKERDLGMLIVIFEPTKTKKELSKSSVSKQKLSANELVKELKITKDQLQAAIDECATCTKELQITNEDYQSSREELQSANEELITSREELQSMNEELISLNSELRDKITQLSDPHDDLNNLLHSVDVATIYLDRNSKIKRFTPAATKIFNIIESDIDRPIADLSSNLVYDSFEEDVKKVLRTLTVKTCDVHSSDGPWYKMRIVPYRSAENVIQGVLATFLEITDKKYMEEQLIKTNEQLNLIMENFPAIPFTCEADPKIKITFVGKSCEKVTGFLPEQFTRKSSFWISRIHPDDKKKVLLTFSSIIKKGKSSESFRWKCSDGKYKHFVNYLRNAKWDSGRPSYIVGVWQELTNGNNNKKQYNGK